jgi:outer membrane protein assembly factor BamB
MKASPSRSLIAAISLLFAVSSPADWPMYLHDAARSGFTKESIKMPLAREWVHVSVSEPKNAWAPPIPHVVEGNLEIDRLDFDHAFQVVADQRSVYFGSSSSDQVYCLNLADGRPRWTFFTDGPVRLAPSLDNGRLYFGSDDGFVYCLNAADGKLIWKQVLGFNNRKHLGNGRLISRWPVRTSVLVDAGVAYCGAGVFPHEGIILAALDARTGKTIWKNDTLGDVNANRSRLTPQGYLIANDKYLYVPSGRDLPASFNRADGTLRFHASASWRGSGIVGGTYGVLVDDQLITGANQNVAFDAETGRTGAGWFDGRRMVVQGKITYLAKEKAVAAIDREKYGAGSRKLLEMKRRHDGREKDDPKYLWSASRSLQREEEARRPAQRNPTRIAELKRDVKKYYDQIKAMEKEEAEFDRSYKAEATLWQADTAAFSSLIATPATVFAGGDGKVVAINAKSGSKVWQAKVDGVAAGLAVSNGRLLVTSDTGRIYCFAPGKTDRGSEKAVRTDFADGTPAEQKAIRNGTEQIMKHLPSRRGYALVLGLKTGQLAWELANRTGMKIIAIDPDPKVADRVRRNLADTGYYGNRIHVLEGDIDQLPNYFANVIVSESAVLGAPVPARANDVARMVRPLGGKVVLGNSGAAQWLGELNLGKVSSPQSGWASVTRAGLPGAGKWTHQYGTSGNTGFSDETRLTAPLAVLWYGDPGPTQMINRHSQGTPPVSMDGRIFIIGENVLLAYDAYNGTKLWEASYEGKSRYRTRSIPGNLIVDQLGVFIATQSECIRFDSVTGKRLNVYPIPKDLQSRSSSWSYLGLNKGVLVGSVTESLLPASSRHSRALFAYNIKSGKHLWTYEGDKIAQMTIALGDWRVFLVDSRMTAEQLELSLQQDRSHLQKLTGDARKKAEAKLKDADRRLGMALELETGKEIWSKVLDLTDCTGLSRGAGELMTMYHNGTLIFAGASGNGHYWTQFLAGEFKDRKLMAVDAVTGQGIWSREANYRIRPLIKGDEIVAEPWAFDLYTGKQKTRKHPMTGEESPWQFIRSGHHCGHVSATENLLFFRSGSTAYYDVEKDSGVAHFAGMRTGCTINMIPANGLVHMPEASAGCQCLFAIQSTVTMEPVTEDRAWNIFTTPGPGLPISRLHVNFGAPGDRRDGSGNLWLAFPRPRSSSNTRPLDLPLDLEVEGLRPTTYQRLTETHKIASTANPWVLSSGYEGVTHVGVPVLGKNDQAGVYDVRLHFAELDNVTAGSRRFDIALQEKVHVQDFDIRKIAGSSHRAIVREIKNVDIFDWLELSLKPKDGKQPPILSGLELIRTGDSTKPKPASLRYPQAWPDGVSTITLQPIADSRVSLKYPTRNEGANATLGMDGGSRDMQDESYSMVYLKFRLPKIPGRPIGAKLRLRCLGDGSRDAGNVYLVPNDWNEMEITYEKRPAPLRRIGKVGNVGRNATVHSQLALAFEGDEISILLRPTSTDGIQYGSRESKKSPELVIAYEK